MEKWEAHERRLDKLEGALTRLTDTITDAMTGKTETALQRHWVKRIEHMETSINENRKHFDQSVFDVREDVANVQIRVNQIFAGLAVLTVVANIIAPFITRSIP